MVLLLDTNAVSELMRSDGRVEAWLASLSDQDSVVTCTIVRGEILFGISRLPEGKRRTELEQVGGQFLDAFECVPLEEAAGDLYSQLNSRAIARDSCWMKTTCGSPQRQ